MDKQVYGQGHSDIIPDQLMAKRISNEVFDKALDTVLTPNIAMADADFEGDLLCGSVVTFMERDFIDESLFQDTQGNEEPETDVVTLDSNQIKICNKKDFKIKLSVHQLRKLQCEGLDSVYFDTVEQTISHTLDYMWDESHLAHMIMMASRINTGNNAMDGLADLGSPDKPIVIPRNRAAGAEKLEEVFSALQLILNSHNAMTFTGDTALVMPTLVENRAQPIFRDLNICCGDDNIRVKGQLPKTIYGFDAYQTNRQVLSTVHNNRRIYYIIAADKKASGFVSDMYNFKWYEGLFDWFLVGTEVHGSYITQPDNIAVAVVTFDN